MPLITGIVCAVMLALTLLLYCVPLRVVILLAVSYLFVKKGLQRYRLFGFGLDGQDTPTAVENVVGRVPSDLDNARRRLLAPKIQARPQKQSRKTE